VVVGIEKGGGIGSCSKITYSAKKETGTAGEKSIYA
jgi:hypothetical protein